MALCRHALLLLALLTQATALDVDADNPMVRWTGRTLATGSGSVRFDWTGVAAEVMIKGTSSVKVRLLDPLDSLYRVDIDGAFNRFFYVDGGGDLEYDAVLTGGLVTTEWTRVTVTKVSETGLDDNSVVEVKYFLVDDNAELQPVYDIPTRKLLIIGDLFSTGYASMMGVLESVCRSVDLASSVLDGVTGVVCTELQAECHYIAALPLGVVHNIDGKSGVWAMPAAYTRTFASDLLSPAWNTSLWVPDAIYVNLGIVDTNHQNLNVDPTYDAATFESTYETFLDSVRGGATSTVPTILICNVELGADACDRIKAVAGRKTDVTLLEIPDQGSSCSGAAKNSEVAAVVANTLPAMRVALGWDVLSPTPTPSSTPPPPSPTPSPTVSVTPSVTATRSTGITESSTGSVTTTPTPTPTLTPTTSSLILLSLPCPCTCDVLACCGDEVGDFAIVGACGSEDEGSSGGLSTMALGGILVGAAVAIVGGAYMYTRCRSNSKGKDEEEDNLLEGVAPANSDEEGEEEESEEEDSEEEESEEEDSDEEDSDDSDEEEDDDSSPADTVTPPAAKKSKTKTKKHKAAKGKTAAESNPAPVAMPELRAAMADSLTPTLGDLTTRPATPPFRAVSVAEVMQLEDKLETLETALNSMKKRERRRRRRRKSKSAGAKHKPSRSKDCVAPRRRRSSSRRRSRSGQPSPSRARRPNTSLTHHVVDVWGAAPQPHTQFFPDEPLADTGRVLAPQRPVPTPEFAVRHSGEIALEGVLGEDAAIVRYS